jgi:diguanylate cyclase (GGDEF)-like protein
VADGIWWVGVRLPHDQFQCHAYFLENGDASVLVDPGSPLTIEETLERVSEISPVDSIRYLVCHHADPDIAASLPYLSTRLSRDDVQVVTEWRAAALLKHYGHRFPYYLVEAHGWVLPLSAQRRLEFQLTPYLHFPGAMVSYDTATETLFSSDLFGGFVPDNDILVSDDVDYIVANATPFHQHYMPSRELLAAGLTRVQQRWPHIQIIAPQHGHIIPAAAVAPAFEALKAIECGVFTLADADMDLKRLLHLSEARTDITQALLTIADPLALVRAIDATLEDTGETRECALFIDLPEQGWTMWGLGHTRHVHRDPPSDWPQIALPGAPAAVLSFSPVGDQHPDEDLLTMLRGLAATIRPAIDQYLHDHQQARRVSDLRRAAFTDPLTGLGNRRALDTSIPVGDYALISLDLDLFKEINDEFGHATGDLVLSRVADVLSASIRGDDAAFRMGGEEFLIVLPHADAALAATVSERVRRGVKGLDPGGRAPGARITISLGVASVVAGEEADFPAVMARADAALYESKHAGRDRVTVSTP